MTVDRLPRGVELIERVRGGRAFRAAIKIKGVTTHLGLYETPFLAGLAYHLAAEATGRKSSPPVEAPDVPRASADQVRILTERIRRRLGLTSDRTPSPLPPPSAEALETFFEVTVLGFWRDQARRDDADSPGAALDAAAGRVVAAAGLVLACAGLDPREMMVRLLVRRLDAKFRQRDLTTEILHDDGDEPWRVARWLAYPDQLPSGRGFRDEVRFLYADFFEGDDPGTPSWATLLGIAPPFRAEQIRAAYRARSKSAHPDAGGSTAAFVRLNEAYEAAMDYCRSRGEV